MLERFRSQAEAADPLLLCRSLGARYGRIGVVQGVDLQVFAGEVLAVLGANGAGKSSLLGAIAGIVSGSGDVIVGNTNIASLSAHSRAGCSISFVPERRGNIFPTISVAENVEIGLHLSPKDKRDQQRTAINELFPILARRSSSMAGVLSGGEQQMLAIGMALGRDPSILLLDEPTQGLAPAVLDGLVTTIETLKSRKLAIVLAEQNIAFASRVADRFIVLSGGSLTKEGNMANMSDVDALPEALIGVPSETENRPKQ